MTTPPAGRASARGRGATAGGAGRALAAATRVLERAPREIGNIWFGPALRRTPAATEAIYLLAHHAFDELGYRRLEWRCNALNAPSRRAAQRFGFTFEGIFRSHQIVKGRNRDTAWYAIVADDWPLIRSAFQRWLRPTNFDSDGTQRRSLGEMRADASRRTSGDGAATPAAAPR